MPPRSAKLRDKTRPRDDQIVRLYNDGQTIEAISAQLHSSKDTCRMILNERGIPRRRSTDEWPELQRRNDYIVDAYKLGIPLSQIAEKVGLSPDGARFILNKVRGVPCTTPEDRQRANRGRDREIAKLYRRGLTQKQVGQQVGLSQAVVQSVLKQMKVPIRSSVGRKMPEQERWKELRRLIARAAHLYTMKGMTTAQIGKRLGMQAHTVSKNLKLMGIEVRHGKSTLTSSEVRLIRERLIRPKGRKTSPQNLAHHFGMSDASVRAIGTGESWKNIPWQDEKRYVPKRSARLDAAAVGEIKRLIVQGKTTRTALLARFDMTPGMLKHILKGSTWSSVPWPPGRNNTPARRVLPPDVGGVLRSSHD